MDQTTLFRAILDDPDDDAPRLAFADWLAANGQPDRAEWIRASCELSSVPYGDLRRAAMSLREREAFERCLPSWWTRLTSIRQTNDRGVFRFILGDRFAAGQARRQGGLVGTSVRGRLAANALSCCGKTAR